MRASCCLSVVLRAPRGANRKLDEMIAERASLNEQLQKAQEALADATEKLKSEESLRGESEAEVARLSAELSAAKEQLVAERQEEKRMARAAVKEAHERARFHRDINKTLERLDVREQRRAKENPAWAEFWTEVCSIPGQVERWLAKK